MEEQVAQATAWAAGWERMRRPTNELPAVLGLAQVIGEADGVLVAIGAVRVFTTGLGLDLMVRVRSADLGATGALYGHGPHGPLPLAERLLVGVEYPDGRRASNRTDIHVGPVLDKAGSAVLVLDGGGGGDHEADHHLWLAPLPPPGPLAVVCLWPAAGIPETRTVLDGTAITEAARMVRQLWPWEPEQPGEEAVTPPERPTTGWFAYGGF